MPEGRLILFGTPHAELGTQVVVVSHRKPLALLAYLGVTRRVQSRETLATLLWPEHETSRAYAYLRNALWQLGQTSLGAWLSVDQDTVALLDQVWVDATQMEARLAAVRGHGHPPGDLCADCAARLTEATALYQGGFMAGFTLNDSPDFEEWLYFQAEHFRQETAVALQTLTHYHSVHGHIDTALTAARCWSALDPLDEPAQRALMTLYARTGQRAAALHQYDTALRGLRASRLEPAAETVTLYKQIRAGEIEEATSPAAIGVAVPTDTPRPHHNVPAQTTLFVGRRAELSELYDLLLLPECRLITLTGPGGIGKTRLALQAAQEQVGSFPDGVTFVPLVAATDTGSMSSAIAEALGTSFYPQSSIAPQEQLLAYLSERKVLLVLDNLEHLLEHTGLLVQILAHAPGAKLLVTSRERLNLRGEWVMELQGLACESGNASEPAGSDATALFVETAQRITASFEPSAAELNAIARICELVEGMPLGIELAAAWTKMLSCAEIANEVEASLDFLTMALRDLPEQHQSLRAVFARSWGLLSEAERRHFRGLAVFRGGFTREAAQAVVDAGLPALSALMDKSLLRRTAGGRFEILEVLRQYAAEQLQAVPGEAETVQTRHAAYYLDLVRRMENPLRGQPRSTGPIDQRAALGIIQRDFANIRVGWQWSIRTGMFDEISGAAFSFGLFCDIRNRFTEGEAMARAAADALKLRRGDAMPLLLGLLRGLQGELMSRQGNAFEGWKLIEQGRAQLPSEANHPWFALLNVMSTYMGIELSTETRQERLEESLRIYRALGDSWGISLVQQVLGEILISIGDFDAAERLLNHSLAIRNSTDDYWGAAMTLYALGVNSAAQQKNSEVLTHFRESIATRESISDLRGTAIARTFLANWLQDQGDPSGALALYELSLQGYQEVGDLHNVAHTLSAIGRIYHSRSDLPKAYSTLCSALERHRAVRHDREMAQLLGELGHIAEELGDFPRSRSHLTESLAIYEQLGDEPGSTAVRDDLARLQNSKQQAA